MVKILGVCGSPRRSSTYHALSVALKAAAEIEDIEVELVIPMRTMRAGS
jgi:multimeric flavodoxin WrbA